MTPLDTLQPPTVQAGIGISAFIALVAAFLVARGIWAFLSRRVRPPVQPQQDPVRQERQPESEDRTETVIYDPGGNEVLRLGQIRTEGEGDGREYSETLTEYREMADGSVWGPAFLIKDGQKGTVVACEACRRESRRGGSQMIWTPIISARRCLSCGHYFCGVHCTLSSDNHIRCRPCNRRYWWLRHVAKPIFFEEVKE